VSTALADALASAIVLVSVEALVVAAVHRRAFAGAWELRQALRLLPIVGLAAVIPVVVVGALLLGAVRRAERPAFRVAVALGALAFGGAVGFSVSTGRHLASWALRAPFVAVVAGVAAAGAYASAPALARIVRRAPAVVAGAAALAIAGLDLVNATVLPRLYPGFHAGLAVLTLLACPALALAWRDGEPTKGWGARAYAAAIVALSVLAVVGSPRIARALVRADNVRFVFADRSPRLRYAVELVATLAPDDRPSSGDAPTVAEDRGEIDLRGRDVVVISIDALRADHVGAYGYPRPITPNIDALAREGAVFSHAYCATPHTSYSVTSMMTGKYMRPLLLEGAGEDSDTLASLLRTYGYRTAGFYPPAVFFIDRERFSTFQKRGLDFEYRRVEVLPATERAAQVASYLDRVREGRRVLLWVHLFEPHEPYVTHPEHDLGPRDLDRYDGEIAAADEGVGAIVAAVRKRRPGAAIVITADHGEEFGEHGGRYHGTTVHEEQARVPLVIVAPGVIAPRTIDVPVQTVDILPTVLSSLSIPRPARVRGRDLTGLLSGHAAGQGFAFAETDEQTLLAEGSLRLVCARRAAACQLFDVATDPGETRDVAASQHERFEAMKKRLREVEGAHGRYELAGLRAEGKAWPEALRRGIAGDGDAALDVAGLLDDADVGFRRKAAEILFELARPESAPALRLSVTRDEDDVVRRWAALALARLGEGSARALELAEERDPTWRRLAALALAENGDGRGEGTLVAWLEQPGVPFERMRAVVRALGKIRSKRAIVPVGKLLTDVRLGPEAAAALAAIGDSAGRGALLEAFRGERYQTARIAIAEALIKLGAGGEMGPALIRFLGVPDPLPGGVGFAERGGFLPAVGGPDKKDLARLRDPRAGTRRVTVIVPRGEGACRAVVRGRSRKDLPAEIEVGVPLPAKDDAPAELDTRTRLTVQLPPGKMGEIAFDLPFARPGTSVTLAVRYGDDADVSALVIVPKSDELPPPPPAPWTPTAADRTPDVVDDGT
jgi:hypothetical protein